MSQPYNYSCTSFVYSLIPCGKRVVGSVVNSEIRGAYNFRSAATEHSVLFVTWKSCFRDIVAIAPYKL